MGGCDFYAGYTGQLNNLDYTVCIEQVWQGGRVTTSLSPTAIYSSRLGGRRAGWGTKCDLYIYSRTEKNLYPATVSQHWEAFLGCTEVIYPFVKSTEGECTN